MPNDERYWAVKAAGRIGLPKPTTGYGHWLSLHWTEAWACMEIEEFGRMATELREMGWTT
jgi:hypothetical protein